MNELVVGLLVLAVTIFLLGLVLFVMARSERLKRIAEYKWPNHLTREDFREAA